MDNNQMYMQALQIDEVPWNRLITTYGTAEEFPQYFKTIWDMADKAAVKKALDEVANNIEHQSTLWHSTPFAVIFLVRIFNRAVSERANNEIAHFVAEQLLDLFHVVAVCFRDAEKRKHADPLPLFSDIVKEEYLFQEDCDEEEAELYFEELPDDCLFYSLYYYSYQALLSCKPILKQLESTALDTKVKKLEETL